MFWKVFQNYHQISFYYTITVFFFFFFFANESYSKFECGLVEKEFATITLEKMFKTFLFTINVQYEYDVNIHSLNITFIIKIGIWRHPKCELLHILQSLHNIILANITDDLDRYWISNIRYLDICVPLFNHQLNHRCVLFVWSIEDEIYTRLQYITKVIPQRRTARAKGSIWDRIGVSQSSMFTLKGGFHQDVDSVESLGQRWKVISAVNI